jgi:hypothetical protein
MSTPNVNLTKPATEIEIGLSAKGLGNLPRNVYENDFTFVVGDSQYCCPSVVACFLSPRICDLQRNDPTIQEFHIDTPDPNHSFESILKLCSGSGLPFRRNDAFVRLISHELGNGELYEAITANLTDELSVENVIARLRFSFELGDGCAPEIEFCSSHFCELEAEDLRSLPFALFSAIISRKSILLADEDSFYSIIHSRICDDSDFFSLFEYVRFEYLSSASIHSFIELMNESINRMTIGLWGSVCRRLSFPISPELSHDRFMASINSDVCPFSSRSPLDGIISHLTRKHGGHRLDSGLMLITASGLGDPAFHPVRNLATVWNDALFYTPNTPHSWICYDFDEMRITLTHYSIRTRSDCDQCHLRHWRLDGSMDGLSWTELDRRKNDTTLSGRGAIATFSIGDREGNREGFRMIRLRQTGRNSSGEHFLTLTAIEFFGVITTPKQ